VSSKGFVKGLLGGFVVGWVVSAAVIDPPLVTQELIVPGTVLLILVLVLALKELQAL
jgi:hypothetical protein